MRRHPVLLGLLIVVALIVGFILIVLLFSRLGGKKPAFVLGDKIGIVEINGVIMSSQQIIDQLIAYASPLFARGSPPSQGGNLQFLLPRRRYDLIVGLRDDWTTLKFSLLSGAKHRVDRGTVRVSRKFRVIASRLGLASRPAPMHEVESNLRIVGTDSVDDSSRPHLAVRGDALEWADRGILVNALAPSHFRTPFHEANLRDPEKIQRLVSQVPLGRFGEPREIVGPAVFLASEASSMVTGHVLAVDGGMTVK